MEHRFNGFYKSGKINGALGSPLLPVSSRLCGSSGLLLRSLQV